MNKMTNLLNKMERRLGTKPLNLPDDIKKEKWATEVIANETLDTFSRYFPHAVLVTLDTQKTKNGYCLIDDFICEQFDIIGIRDIDWKAFSRSSPTMQMGSNYGMYDFLTSSYDVEDAMMGQMVSDHVSLFNNGIYFDFQPPNMLKFTSSLGYDLTKGLREVPMKLLVKHPTNLMTISPTKFELFEKLALADIASFLFQYLKHYDGIETVFANVDLKLSYIENEANKRDEVVQKIEEGYVSAGNENQPLMFTV